MNARGTKLTFLRRLWAACPVTCVFALISLALFVAAEVQTWRSGEGAMEVRRSLGAIIQLMSGSERQLAGPLDVWSGQWWRVLVSPFHHGGWFHLVMNLPCLLLLGMLLEPRMRRTTYALFFISAAVVSFLPEVLLGNSAVGLSGAICAQFGALLALRRRDPELATVITERSIRVAFAYLVGCVIITEMKLLPFGIANAAHFSGIGYGWLAGLAIFGSARHQRALRVAFCAAHLAILPALYYAAHPVWNGRYHWYLSRNARSVEQRLEHLQRAVARDPGLGGAWRHLAFLNLQQGRFLPAWRAALECIGTNSTDGSDRSVDSSIRLAQLIWFQLPSREAQEEALQMLAQILGDDNAAAWQERIGAVRRPEPQQPLKSTENDRIIASPLETQKAADAIQRLIRRLMESRRTHEQERQTIPPVDPDAPDSAAEGVTI